MVSLKPLWTCTWVQPGYLWLYYNPELLLLYTLKNTTLFSYMLFSLPPDAIFLDIFLFLLVFWWSKRLFILGHRPFCSQFNCSSVVSVLNKLRCKLIDVHLIGYYFTDWSQIRRVDFFVLAQLAFYPSIYLSLMVQFFICFDWFEWLTWTPSSECTDSAALICLTLIDRSLSLSMFEPSLSFSPLMD